MKRNRVGTEDELTHLALTKPPPPQPQHQQQQPKNLPKERAEASNPPKFGEFLERCHYCKKYMPAGEEVFMYRDFCGFCSTGCRDIQISLDKLAEKQVELAEKQVASFKDNGDQFKGMADKKSQYSFK